MPTRPWTVFAPVLLLALTWLLAGPAGAQTPTHLNQRIEEHVMLESVISADSACFGLQGRELRRMFPDGTTAGEEFAVPEGYNLVVTDVEWLAHLDEGHVGPDTLIFLFVSLLNGPDQADVFASSPVPADRFLVAGSDQLTSGFVVGPEAVLCPFAAFRFNSPGSQGGGGVELRNVKLRGYLVAGTPPDGDGDGVPDPDDACADTEPGAEVDADGCSVGQFCAALTPQGNWACIMGDWKGDEAGSFYPYDCRYQAGQCVPY